MGIRKSTNASKFPLSTSSAILPLTKFRRALARSQAGGDPAKILLIGNSHTTGQQAGSGTNGWTGAAALNIGAGIQEQLDNQLAACTRAFFGGSNMGSLAQVKLYDPRVAWPNGSTIWATGGVSLGGCTFDFFGAATTTDGFEFTPTEAFDRFVIWTENKYGNTNRARVWVDGVEVGTIVDTVTTNGIDGFQFAAASLAIHTIRVTPNEASAQFLKIKGVGYWNSAKPGCMIISAGSGGMQASTLLPNIGLAAGVGPDLAIIEFGTNELFYTATPAAYDTALRGITDAVIAMGSDAILTCGFPANLAGTTNGLLASYIEVTRQIAAERNLNFVDRRKAYGSTYAEGFAAGLINADGMHPTRLGYMRDVAEIVPIILGAR